jgi:aspartate/methionine/tyrosine aminotransferase
MYPARSAFDRLRGLLDGIAPPAGLPPIELQLGESRLQSGVIDPAVLADPAGWARYPQLGGTPELRAAYGQWLARRFGVQPGLSAGRIAIEPTPGSKQALAVVIALAVMSARGHGDPAVILPNPFYPTYWAATEAVGARPVFYPTSDDMDATAIRAAVHTAGGRAAAIIVCNPGNPRGEIMPADALAELAKIAVAAGALLIVDECYTDLTFGLTAPGYLTVAEDTAAKDTGQAGPFVVLHSLSKRSGAPGLRSGFMAGDPSTVAAYARYNRDCGVSVALPVNAAAAALWADDTHVARAQALLSRNWDLADGVLGDVPQYHRAAAGFFLWLPVGDDEAAAWLLWRRHALRVMPGRYLGTETSDSPNPGVGYLRIALVHEENLTLEALTRLRDAAPSITAPVTSPSGVLS